MNTDRITYIVKKCVIFGLVTVAASSKAVLSASLDIAQSPLAVSNAAAPRVMLAMSRDHQLFSKAYTDYSDLNNDGVLETTYNNNIDYYGYFDSNKCYTYSSNLFQPSGLATAHQCNSQWSGNFLNWATMTRMDIIRKVLYGGYRSTDGGYGGETVLERSLIPYDAHAFAKVFSTDTTAQMQQYTPYAQTAISICNLTQVVGKKLSKDVVIKDNENQPLMRVANGAWPRWAASKNIQCQWSNNNNNNNNNNTLPSDHDNLVNQRHDDGLNVRVKVCPDGLEEANCRSYTDRDNHITKKPTGLLQKYWDSGKPIIFGLMTGSWGNNKSGGVLRKIPPADSPNSPSLQEVNQSNGVFILPDDTSGGIISTLDRFRISKYQFDKSDNDNKYKDCDTGKLSFNNGECVDWGNPLSEIYLETLRYLAGRGGAGQPGPLFASDDSNYVPAVVPPSNDSHPLDKKNWNDPISEGSWCARCSIVAISSGPNTFDTDQLENNDLSINGSDINVADQTDAVGDLEGISGNYLIGSNGSDNNKQCTEKSLSNLSDAKGICPEVPSQEGGYHIAGLAYYARTHDFRAEYTKNGQVFFSGVQSINTYSVALAESLPRFEIPAGSGTITILPACVANSDADATSSSDNWRPCNMTDLIVKNENLSYVNNKLTKGSFEVVWEDSTWGSNYDMDGIERLEFCVGSACNDNSVNTGSIKITASVIQAESNAALRFGYTISGSNKDGIELPILRPGNKNFNVGEDRPSGVTAATASIYSAASTSAKLLENPLWYAAKYGGFDTIDPILAETPALQSWDEDENGIPDAFFKATNPNLLENALDEILTNVSSKSESSASVAANSTRLDTTSALYQAKFTPAKWNGQLLAFQINPANGNLAGTPSWDASEKVTAQGLSGRSIFSYNDSTKTGIIFEHANLSEAQKLLLTADQLNYIKGDQSKEKPDGAFRKRVGPNRLLGDIVNSDPEFINSISQGYDSLPENEGTDYLKYITSPAYRDRPPMLAVGANDGMLHVIDASIGQSDSGQEKLAYVPSTTINNLPCSPGTSGGNLKCLTLPAYIAQGNHKYFVDGTPNSGDVYFDANGDGTREWRKALVGTMGVGGKGLFALDMTLLKPDNYNMKETFSASRVLWEINDKTAPYATDLTDDLTISPKRYGFTNYLGLTMGQASIVRLVDDNNCTTNKKGRFAAVFGNGYNSVNQTAVLYIVDIKTGQLIRSITTGVGNASFASTINGLATPLTVDANGDGIVDAIYAGDYQGNMWKFDVSDCNPDKWDVAFSSSGQPAPLFTAKSTQFTVPNPTGAVTPLTSTSGPQPITAKPEFGKHPKGGIMLYFGTGKYFLNRDTQVNIMSGPVETFYGIWDECVKYAGSTGSCSNAPISNGKSDLAKQSIDYESAVAGYNVRVTSKNAVDYLTVKGWYMELYKGSDYFTAEKVISQPIIRDRRIIFSTILPARGLCSFGGTSWLMLVDALTGKSLDDTAFDLTGDLQFTVDDKVSINVMGVDTKFSVSGVQIKGGMSKGVAEVDTDGAERKLVNSTTSGGLDEHTISKLLGGRQSWLQIR